MSSCISFPRYLDLNYGRKVMCKLTYCETLHSNVKYWCIQLQHTRYSLLRMVVFGEVHHLLIDIQPVNPRRSSTFLFLVPNQRSIKVARPSSVSPLLVKVKAYVLFSWKSVNMVSDVDFISMSRNGQLTGFCHALPKTESRDLIRRSKQTLFI